MQGYTMLYKYGKILLTLVECEMIITKSALNVSMDIYFLISNAPLWRILIIPEVIERKFFCAKAIFECQVHKMGYVSRETVMLRRWWVLQDNLVLSTGLIMWIRYSKEIRFVLTTFWRHLWSITEQTHGNMDSIC